MSRAGQVMINLVIIGLALSAVAFAVKALSVFHSTWWSAKLAASPAKPARVSPRKPASEQIGKRS